MSEVLVSIIILTFGRDEVVPETIERMNRVARARNDVEIILVDNNDDTRDRSSLLDGIPEARLVKIGTNKGTTARNDGAAVARGRYLLFMDDDSYLEQTNSIQVYLDAFEINPKAAIVTARVRDHKTGMTLNKYFPHTDNSRSKEVPFRTFRFQGTGFMIRRDAYDRIGPIATQFFWGHEELDYAYRVISKGYEIYYEPGCWVVEKNHPAGRGNKKKIAEERLANKFIISYKYLPWLPMIVNIPAFGAYMILKSGLRINPFAAFGIMIGRIRREGIARTPLPQSAVDYIRECGGAVWK